MTFPYNSSIPTVTSVPSQDASIIQTNFLSTQNLIAVDHVGFNALTGTGGRHNQVTYNALQTPGVPIDPVSVLYTANDSGMHPNQYFKNSQAAFLLSCVKAFGSFNSIAGVSGTTSILNGYNIDTTVTKVSGSNYNITLTANIINGTNAVVFTNTNQFNTGTPGYILTSGMLTVTTSAAAGFIITFAILQA